MNSRKRNYLWKLLCDEDNSILVNFVTSDIYMIIFY